MRSVSPPPEPSPPNAVSFALSQFGENVYRAGSSLRLVPSVITSAECVRTLGANLFETFFGLPTMKFVNKLARINQRLDSVRYYIIQYGKEKTVSNLIQYLATVPPADLKAVGHDFLQITSRKTSKNMTVDEYFLLVQLIMSRYEFDKYYLKAFYVIPRSYDEIMHMFELTYRFNGTEPDDIDESKMTLLLNLFLVSVEKLSTLQRVEDMTKLFAFINTKPELRRPESNLMLKALSIYLIAMINRRENLQNISKSLEYVDLLDLRPSEIFFNKLLEVLTRNFRNDNLHDVLMAKMESLGVSPSLITFNTLLTITSMSKNFERSLNVFNSIIQSKLKPDSYSLALLVRCLKQSTNVDPNCVSQILALHTENDIALDTVLCNSMIDVFMTLKRSEEAMKIYIRMKADPSLKIDGITFNSLIKGFCRTACFPEAQVIFEEMKKDFPHITPSRIALNSLMDAALKERKLQVAMGLFMEMQRFEIAPDSFTYSILLNGLKQAGASQNIIKRTLVSIKQILDISDFKLDEIFFNCILDTCSKYEIFDMMDYFYKVMREKKIGESDITYGILIKAYGKLGNFDRAEELFNQMMQSNMRINNITYGCVLDACAKNGRMQEALHIFAKLKDNGLHMNSVVFTTIIKGFINSEEYQNGIDFFEKVKGFETLEGMLITYNCGLDAYVRMDRVSDAIGVFKEIETKFGADLVSYSTILKVFIQNNIKDRGYKYFLKLLNSNITPDISIVNLFMDSCANYHDFKMGLKIFEQADLHRIRPNEVTFGIMIKVYGFAREVDKAFDLIPVMKAYGISPSIIVYTNLIHISFYNKKLRRVEEAYSLIKKNRIRGDRLMYSKLIDGFLRFRDQRKALKYLNFAHQEQVPIKTDVADKLEELLPEGSEDRRKLKEVLAFKQNRPPKRQGFGGGRGPSGRGTSNNKRTGSATKKESRRGFGRKFDMSNRGSRGFYNRGGQKEPKKMPQGHKPGTLFNFRKRAMMKKSQE